MRMAEKEGTCRCRAWNKSQPAHVNSDMAALHIARGRSDPRLAGTGRVLIRRLTMKVSRILSAVFVLLALALGSLATSACTSATDSSASGTSGNSGSGGGY
jgi:hypothetical protein